MVGGTRDIILGETIMKLGASKSGCSFEEGRLTVEEELEEGQGKKRMLIGGPG